ncbi:uncharacterized protein LOC131428599 [Malaya genurostris]|uniref:uncharacterized protein LOC131428599 n=1 Tax=Malaya genurostris TaxID=325434 RepID=UPI0026F3BB52|nr:uncharacterized protein LOC131428599 [Malaya genurostris]
MRLCRTVAYVHRYSQNLRRTASKEQRLVGPLSQEELDKGEKTVFRWIQSECYSDEMRALALAGNSANQQIRLEKSSKIRKLSPYLDDSGIIRSDSRIAAAAFASYDTRFPVVLPKAHWATRLLVEWYHSKYLHANGETIVNEMRQRFHISQLRSFVRKVAKDCVECKVKKPVPMIPRMAPLPAARLRAYVRPFSFIESCKLAIRRFIGRRGAPLAIRSDRGTNFVGSRNELEQEMNEIDRQLAETFTNATTRWILNPPGAPHMGGAWERLVRSVKTAFAAISTSRTPNEETLATLLVEAESVVNSRPLTYIPLETAQQEALTPNHFLLSSSSGVIQPPRTLGDPKQACRNEWNLCRVMIDHFWSRWVREYLPTIARRTKWFDEERPIAVGDLVIIVEEKIRNGWTRGRVVQVVAGRDGRVREAVIQTARGLIRRPVAKLARLDIAVGKTGPEVPDQPYGSGNCYG